MGGRGASSGISNKGNKYGTQYKTLFQVGNIKFVTKNSRTSEALMETMTKGRVYVTAGEDKLKSITYFDEKNKRVKTIDLDHYHNKLKPHVQEGYYHDKEAREPNTKEKKMIQKAYKLWYNHKKGKL